MILVPDGLSTNYSTGLLYLFIGMPLMMETNMATELGISSGSPGVIHNNNLNPKVAIDYSSTELHFLKYHPTAGIYAEQTTYIDPKTNRPKVKLQLPNLPPNIYLLHKDSAKGKLVRPVKYQRVLREPILNMVREQFLIYLPAELFFPRAILSGYSVGSL
jgi:hypothetical protein